MEVARARALEGAPHGTTIVAERQEAGRGRRGRSWVSQPGAGLYMTTLLWPESAPGPLYFAALVAGVAVQRAVGRLGVGALLKWPNDVVVRRDGADKKLAGILLEAETSGRGARPLVLVGIGLNLSPGSSLQLPAEVAERYVGLQDLVPAGAKPLRAEALAAVTEELAAWWNVWMAQGSRPVLDAFGAADALRGERVRAELPDGACEGVARGIDGEGSLIIDTAAGRRLVTSGEVVRLRPA